MTAVYGNYECSVSVPDEHGFVWAGPLPLVGDSVCLGVVRHLEAIRSLLLAPRTAV